MDDYSMGIHAAYQRDMVEMNKRIRALEQVARDWLAHSQREQLSHAAWQERESLQERTKALLEQEVKE